MKIMSFNLRSDCIFDINNRWVNRKDIVTEIMFKYNCDIIGVQELTNKMHKDIIAFAKNFNIVGKARSKKLFAERNDLIIPKNHIIEDHKTIWLSETPNKVGSQPWFALYPRICTTAKIKLEDGTRLRIYNTHLDCLLPQARDYGIKKLSKFVENNYKEDNLPIIIMGDFNATPNSKIIKNFSNGKYLSKRFFAVQEKNTELYNKPTRAGFKGKDKGFHIDYIFVSEELEIIDVDIITDNKDGKYPSDHFPLIANIALKKHIP